MRRTRCKAHKPQKRLFICPECGVVVPATKYYGKTSVGHIKTMYCYQCKEDKDFEQIE